MLTFFQRNFYVDLNSSFFLVDAYVSTLGYSFSGNTITQGILASRQNSKFYVSRRNLTPKSITVIQRVFFSIPNHDFDIFSGEFEMVCIFFVHGKSFWLINPGWMYTVQKKNFIHSPLKISTFFRYDESLAHESQSPRCTSPRACLFSLYMVDFSSKSYKQYAFQKQIVRVHQFTPQSSNPQATIPHQVTTLLHATLTSHTLRLAFKDPKLKQTGQNVTSNTQPSRT